MKRVLTILSIGTILLSLPACGDKENPENNGGNGVPVTSVTVIPSAVDMMIGETYQLKASVLPGDATQKKVTWMSITPTLAMVSETGAVSALAEGTAVIQASAGGQSGSCTVTIHRKGDQIAVTSITVEPATLTLSVGEIATLTATVSPSNATDQTVTWTSSNASTVRVDNGQVTAVAEGSATITASCGGKSATCTVTVQKATISVTSITLDQTSVTLQQGKTVQLTATVAPSNASDPTVSWSSSNTAVATVQNGLVTAVGVGSATITATAGSKSATCTITVANTSSGDMEGTGNESWD